MNVIFDVLMWILIACNILLVRMAVQARKIHKAIPLGLDALGLTFLVYVPFATFHVLAVILLGTSLVLRTSQK